MADHTDLPQAQCLDGRGQVLADKFEGVTTVRNVGIAVASLVKRHYVVIGGQSVGDGQPGVRRQPGGVHHDQRRLVAITPFEVMVSDSVCINVLVAVLQNPYPRPFGWTQELSQVQPWHYWGYSSGSYLAYPLLARRSRKQEISIVQIFTIGPASGML